MSKGTILTRDQVLHVAKLSKLTLTDEEVVKFQKQLSQILSYIGKLNELDTKGIIPTNQVTGLTNITREDKTRDTTLTATEALSNAPQKERGFFKVPAIFEE